MSRLPIRLRLTLAFTLALAVVLAATGAFLYFRLGSSLTESVDEGVQTRTAELRPLVAGGRPASRAGETASRPTSASSRCSTGAGGSSRQRPVCLGIGRF